MFSSLGVNVVISDSAGQTVGGFTDVKAGDYFADPVVWAVNRKITAGTSATTFSPNQNCTVAQILTFLYRAYGSPRVSVSNPFSDVKSGDYYAEAAVWAYEKGMVSGSTFGGNRPCTRSMAVTYMWKAASDANLEADFAINNGYLSQYTGSSSDVVIPNSVITICVYSCYDDSLTSVTIPNSVTAIGINAFSGCTGLTSVVLRGKESKVEIHHLGIWGRAVKGHHPLQQQNAPAVCRHRLYRCSRHCGLRPGGQVGGRQGRDQRNLRHHLLPGQRLHPGADRDLPAP